MSSTTNPTNKALIDKNKVDKNISTRGTKNKIYKGLFFLCTVIGLEVLVALPVSYTHLTLPTICSV